MHCLYCGKPLGFLKELTDGEFCSGKHRQRYKKLTKLALARLLETQTEVTEDLPPPAPGLQMPARPTNLQTEQVIRSKRLAKLFPHDPDAVAMPVQLRSSQEAVERVPPPSLPGFSQTLLKPALGNAAIVWSRVEPAAPAQPGLAVRASLETTSSASGTSARMDSLSGGLRQASIPTLRQAELAPPSHVLPQPRLSLAGHDDRYIRPILESRPALAMPALGGETAGSSLCLAQPALRVLAVEARMPARPRLRVEPIAFHKAPVWTACPSRSLSTIGFPLPAADLVSQRPCLEAFSVQPRLQAPAGKFAFEPDWQPLAFEPRTRTVNHYSPHFRFALAQASWRSVEPAAFERVHGYAGESVPVFAAIRPVLPKLTTREASALAASELASLHSLEAREGASAEAPPVSVMPHALRPVGVAAKQSELAAATEPSSPPVAGLLPIAPAVPSPQAGLMRRKVEPIPPAFEQPSLPVLRAVPVRQALLPEGTIKEEVRGLDTAAAHLAVAGGLQPASLSVLPALASLFRHLRTAKTYRTSPVVFEGVRPKDRMQVPLAYMELSMPYRAPAVPQRSGMRIVETFEYLRPLDKPGLSPLEALSLLWQRTPAYLRFVTVAACLVLLIWSASPSVRLSEVAANRWTQVQQSIQERATVELVEDFSGGPGTWGGGRNWARTWSLDRAGFVRPGRLALYRPSMAMEDYRVEFLAQIERKSVGWVYRAVDQENYYLSKITIVKAGPLPSLALVRYPVIDGKAGPRVEIPIRVLMHNDTPYRVQVTVEGKNFATAIEGQLVDYWRDDRLKVGGVGFFSDTGARARLYWVKVSHQDDFIGRVCAYFYPNPIQTRSWN